MVGLSSLFIGLSAGVVLAVLAVLAVLQFAPLVAPHRILDPFFVACMEGK